MSDENKRIHSIERAAVRLGDPIAWAPPVRPMPAQERVTTVPLRDATAVPVTEPEIAPALQSIVVDKAALERAGMIDWQATDSRIAEEIRIVQAELLRRGDNASGVQPRPRAVMITSALQGEGKSFAAINIAVCMVRRGQHRVLLVDADDGSTSLSRRLGLSDARGLIDLAGDRRLDARDLTVSSCIDGLDILPHGADVAGLAAFDGNTAAAVIEDLGRRFADRLILIDAPPCLSNSRPHLLAPLVGNVVLLVSAGSTQQSDIEAALGLMRSCPAVSLLLNKVRRWHAHSFGSYAYAA